MTDSYRLLRTERTDTLGQICNDFKVNLSDIWLPLQVLRSKKGKDETPIPISSSTSVVLLEQNSGKLITRRSDILARVSMLFVDEFNLSISPSAVPAECDIFARATKHMSKKRISEGVTLLHRSITNAEAILEGSAMKTKEEEENNSEIKKCKRTSTESGLDNSTIVGAADANSERRNKRTKSDGLFEEYLKEALEISNKGQITHGNVIIKETMSNLIRVRDATPLHFINHGKLQRTILVKDISWNIPDNRVMYRVFRRGFNSDTVTSFTYTDAARLIAVFIIDNVLIKREPMQSYIFNKDQVWSLIDDDLPILAQKLSERGYRIVLLDHYPSLHHGNNFALEAKLHPIYELCKNYFTCDVTVLISTMSYISASHRRDGMPFVFPYSGIWQFFITQINGGLRADAESLLVGAISDKKDDNYIDASSQKQRDALFAINCGLRCLDRETIKKEILQ